MRHFYLCVLVVQERLARVDDIHIGDCGRRAVLIAPSHNEEGSIVARIDTTGSIVQNRRGLDVDLIVSRLGLVVLDICVTNLQSPTTENRKIIAIDAPEERMVDPSQAPTVPPLSRS